MGWIRKIPNANSNANSNAAKYTCVCEKHFTVEEVCRFHVIGDKRVQLYIFLVCVLYNNIIIIFMTYAFGTNKQTDLKHTHEKNKNIKTHTRIYLYSNINIMVRDLTCYPGLHNTMVTDN